MEPTKTTEYLGRSEKLQKYKANNLNTTNMRERSNTLQFWYGFIAYLSSVAPSMSIGYSAVAIPPLINAAGTIKLTLEEASWFASVASIATPIGCFLSGPISDSCGRKNALFIVNIVAFIGWIILSLASQMKNNQYPILIIGRLFTGLSTGLASITATVYMAEISSSKLRGPLTAAATSFFSLGIVLIYFLGYIFKEDWGAMATITAVLPCVAFALTIYCLPESPSWLINNHKVLKAKKSMCKVFGYDKANEEIEGEIEGLIKNRENFGSRSSVKKSAFRTTINNLKYFSQPSCYKPFVIIATYFFFQQFTGTLSIVFYAIDIVNETGVKMEPYSAIVLIATMRLIAAMAVVYVSKYYGRRPPSIASGIGMTLSLVILAIFLYLKHAGLISSNQVETFSWIPLTSLMFYFFTNTLGFLTLPFAMAAECFPAKIRGTTTGLITCLAYIFNFLIVKTYSVMLTNTGIHGIFIFYAAMSILGTIFVIFILPETKGKTLAEIEEYFGAKKSRNTADLTLVKS